MKNIVNLRDFFPSGKYVPTARYNTLGDFIEYVREDKPYIMRRIDCFLTIALDMDTRKPAGFRLKGFKNFYLNHFKKRGLLLEDHFVAVVAAIEIAATVVGDTAFPETSEKKSAYQSAHAIAAEDQVQILPSAIAA